MIKRIVKLSFKTQHINDFKELFEEYKNNIQKSPGCNSVHLLQDNNHKNTFFTFSIWDNNESLEEYRKSALFNNVWKKTKVMFDEKAQAWSTHEIL
jgi:quinol monooxygenase YgiN